MGYEAEIFAVDLRWGIDVDDTLSRAARERMTLEVCVSEVQRCHPLFVGLLGARYGWVAPPDAERAARASAGLGEIGFPLSVMALEMLTAATSSDRVRPILLARAVREADGSAPGGRDDGSQASADDLLARLKSKLWEAGQTVRTYESRWRPLTGPGGGVRLESEEFVTVLVEELLDRVAELLVLRPALPWLEAELDAHRSAAVAEAAAILGRAEDMGLIAGFWISPDQLTNAGDSRESPLGMLRKQHGRQTLAVVGPSGVGKSSLLAWAAVSPRAHEGMPTSSVRAYVRVGLTVLSRRPAVCLLVLLAQLDGDAAARVAAAIDPDALQMTDVLAPWCQALADQPCAPLIVMDGLDRLESPDAIESIRLGWIPVEPGDQARFLVSTVDEPVLTDVLEVRPSTCLHWLAPLKPNEAMDLVRQIVRAHHRRLPEPVVRVLCSVPRLPRWVVVAADLLVKLMAHDYLALGQSRTPDTAPHEAIAAVLAATSAELPGDLEDLHYEALARLMRLSDTVAPVLLLFRASMIGGLRTDDVLATLELLEQRPAPADLALVRALLSEHITIEHDEWTYRHESAAGGLVRMFEDLEDDSSPEMLATYRHALCAHLMGLPVDDQVRVRLLAPLLWEEGAAVLVHALDRPDVISDGGVAVLVNWLGWLSRKSDGAGAWIATELLDGGTSDRERLTAADVVIGSLLQALEPQERADLASLCRSTLDEIDPATRNRFGQSSAELTQAIEFVAVDPAPGGLAMQVAAQIHSWQIDYLRESSNLHDAPSYQPASGTIDAYFVFDLAVVTEAAMAVASCGVPVRREDADEARSRLASVQARVRQLSERRRYGPTPELMELSVLAAVRAASLAWPDESFVPDPADLTRVRDFVDRQRGNPGAAVVLAWLSRTWAWQELLGVDDDADGARGSPRSIARCRSSSTRSGSCWPSGSSSPTGWPSRWSGSGARRSTSCSSRSPVRQPRRAGADTGSACRRPRRTYWGRRSTCGWRRRRS